MSAAADGSFLLASKTEKNAVALHHGDGDHAHLASPSPSTASSTLRSLLQRHRQISEVGFNNACVEGTRGSGLWSTWFCFERFNIAENRRI